MRCSTLLAILTGVLLYLVLGAVVFNSLEAPREEGKHMQLQDTRRDFLLNFSCVGPDNLQNLIEDHLKQNFPSAWPGTRSGSLFLVSSLTTQ